MKNKILSVKNLQKSYYNKTDETIAIKDITFDLYDKEFVCIVGPSGCGKSTFLNILTDMDTKTSGEITLASNHQKFGYMLQSDSLLSWKNVFDNACLGLDITKTKNSTTLNYVNNLLTTYNLESFKNSYPEELSGGMRQRVALIRTLALKPDILVLDEPFSKLDYQTRLKVSDDVYQIIKKEEKTALMVTHDLAEAISLSDRIIVLSCRPCQIKKIFELKWPHDLSPLEKRQDKNFTTYYDLIWKELINNE